MKVCVTGATGFVAAHVTRALAERGDEVRVAYRNPDRLSALAGLTFRRAKADVLDYKAMQATRTARSIRGDRFRARAAGPVSRRRVLFV